MASVHGPLSREPGTPRPLRVIVKDGSSAAVAITEGRPLSRPWLDALRQPDIRRLEVGWGLSLTGTFGYTVALLAYAYAGGGASLVAVYGFASTLPAIVVTPVLMSLTDRLGSARTLRATTALRTLLIAIAAGVALAGSPPLVVVLVAAAAHSLSATFRPTQASVLPWLARTPAELTGATVTATIAENLAALVGPILAGVVIVISDAATAITVSAACLALATLSLRGLSVPDGARSTRPTRVAGLVRDAAAGGAALARIGRPGGMAVLGFAQPFVRGALLVLMIILALDTLGLDADSVGWLNAAIGLGGLVGGAVAARVIRMSNLARCLVVGVGGWGVGVLVLSAAPTGAAAFAALVLVGLANAFEDAATFVLMPRFLGPELAGRALGAFEVLVMGGMGSGAILAPVLADWVGVRGALVLVGSALIAVTLAYVPAFARIDRDLPPPPPETEVLHEVALFAPLPVVVIEQLATAAEQHSYADGEVVMREGDPGDRFFVVTSGSAAVTVAGQSRPDLGPGDGFGEIALLRGVPRTATVTAAGSLRALSLTRERFLTAVSGNRVSAERAESLATRRLAMEPPAP